MKQPSSITHDSISLRGAGVVHIAQPAKGHRFTLDSVLLADFCRIKARDTVLEAGAGTGIISLLLAKKYPRAHFTAVEIQTALHELCERNIEHNSIGNLIARKGDIRKLRASSVPAPLDVLVMNPPYTASGAGRTSPEAGRRTARQDALGPVGLWLYLGRFLKQGGRCFVVLPAERLAEVCSLMQDRRLEPKRLRLVHPRANRPAARVLMEAVRDGGRGLIVLPPLLVHGVEGNYTKEVLEIYGN